MSYANMDHSAWVQGRITYIKKQKMTARDRKAAAEHKGWFAAPDMLNAFQCRAFDILGIVGGGIYNCPISWDTLVWGDKNHRFIIAPWYGALATWDFKELTRLVLLCHDARIRGQISPLGPRHLHIALHERAADGGITRCHPDLAEAVAMHRQEIGEQHPICYCAPVAPVEVPA